VAEPRRTITALRGRGGRVEVELDGGAWRTIPVDAAARAELRVGLELDRDRLRLLRRELRRSAAGSRALRALRARDLAAAELDARLARSGFAGHERAETVERLARTGLVDDARVAASRAGALARRGRGDLAIRWDLERRGLAAEHVDAALAGLEPEQARAARIVEARGAGEATARLLAARGFGEDAVEGALGTAP
jgi:SOS response regulatory protein OraA/RecX